MAAVLAVVGWVDEIIVNQTSGHILNGHLRVELAISRHEATVPVKWVEVSLRDELAILASFDPMASMASSDRAGLDALLRELTRRPPAPR